MRLLSVERVARRYTQLMHDRDGEPAWDQLNEQGKTRRVREVLDVLDALAIERAVTRDNPPRRSHAARGGEAVLITCSFCSLRATPSVLAEHWCDGRRAHVYGDDS